MCERGNSHELRCLAGGSSNSSNTAFEGCNTLFEDIDGRIHDPAVNIAKLLEAKQPRAVCRVIEDVRCGRVDGHGSRIGRLIGLMTSVQLQRLEVLCDFFDHGQALVLSSTKLEL